MLKISVLLRINTIYNDRFILIQQEVVNDAAFPIWNVKFDLIF